MGCGFPNEYTMAKPKFCGGCSKSLEATAQSVTQASIAPVQTIVRKTDAQPVLQPRYSAPGRRQQIVYVDDEPEIDLSIVSDIKYKLRQDDSGPGVRVSGESLYGCEPLGISRETSGPRAPQERAQTVRKFQDSFKSRRQSFDENQE